MFTDAFSVYEKSPGDHPEDLRSLRILHGLLKLHRLTA
ncbi:hypothetical protein C1A50_0564 [Paenibacillus polymyxa]|nr:hypothetical protein C1A50_0564 [Paenibacillus polymyxa]